MEKAFCIEDQIIKLPGLYALWTILYIINIVCLGYDTTGGNSRNFNLYVSLLSHVYVIVSGWNSIFGNKMPSTLLAVAGPLHQYSFWLLLAYYRGDVFHSGPIGVTNMLYCAVVGIFTLSMIVQTWLITLYPDNYREYTKKWNAATKETASASNTL